MASDEIWEREREREREFNRYDIKPPFFFSTYIHLSLSIYIIEVQNV